MKKLPVIISAILVLCGCEQLGISTPISAISATITSNTSTPEIYTATALVEPFATKTTIPTLVYYWYPTITPDPKETPEPTITAPPSRFYLEDLSSGLWIEEYDLNSPTKNQGSNNRHPNSGSFYFFPKGGLIDGKLFQATEKVISHQYGEIYATLDGKEIATIECGQISPIETVITAWTYENHWIVQSICHQEFDIFWDGVSLNKSKGYQSSFAFQLLGQKPFYLFKRNEQVWLYYDGEEFLLGYDKVKLSYCCEYDAPSHYENMITFDAIKDEQLYYVMIGVH